MPSIKQIKLLRFLERMMMIFLIVSAGAAAWLYTAGKLSTNESYAAAGTVLLIMLVIFFIQSKMDAWQVIFVSQAGFAQDEAITSLFDKSPVAYLTIKTNGEITGSNPAAVNLLQGSIDKINGVNFFQLIQSETNTDSDILESKVSAGLTVNDVEASVQTFNGEIIWVMLSVNAYRNDGQRLVSLVDVTEQKHVDTAKSEFVALATHQLRTPIAAIRWNVELLQKNMKDTKSDDQARYLTKIERNVFRMISLINDFLSVSKLEMGTFAAKEEDINMTDFFSSIVDEFTEKITEKQITLDRRDLPPNLTIRTDSRLIHIIVSNLVSNAVKYLVSQGTLIFSYELKGDKVEIVVADNGIGIPEQEVPQLFTKFFRASNAQSHQAEGTGLGLYVVKQSVELLGGTITVESAENKGARFVATIPATVVSVG